MASSTVIFATFHPDGRSGPVRSISHKVKVLKVVIVARVGRRTDAVGPAADRCSEPLGAAPRSSLATVSFIPSRQIDPLPLPRCEFDARSMSAAEVRCQPDSQRGAREQTRSRARTRLQSHSLVRLRRSSDMCAALLSSTRLSAAAATRQPGFLSWLERARHERSSRHEPPCLLIARSNAVPTPCQQHRRATQPLPRREGAEENALRQHGA